MVTPQNQQQPAGSPPNPGIAVGMGWEGMSKAKTPPCASTAGSHIMKPSLVAAEGAELRQGGFSQIHKLGQLCEGARRRVWNSDMIAGGTLTAGRSSTLHSSPEIVFADLFCLKSN